MHVRTMPGCHVLKLDRGEEIVETLCRWATKARLPGGEIRAIGALRDIELGYFDVDSREYQRALFPASMELVTLLGNLAWDEESPVLHAHAVLAGPDLVARAGHLFRGVVSVTCEVVVRPFSDRVQRILDPEVGLKLLGIQGPEEDG